MVTQAKVNKLITCFTQSISRATYELGGVEQEAVYTLTVAASTVKVIFILENNIAGTIGNFKVYDSDGVLVCARDMSFVKIAGKKQYVAFKFKFAERMI